MTSRNSSNTSPAASTSLRAGEADCGERFLVVIGNGVEVDAAAKGAPLP